MVKNLSTEKTQFLHLAAKYKKSNLRSNFVCGVRRKPFEFDETFWTNIGLLAQCALCNVRGNFSFQGIVSASGL